MPVSEAAQAAFIKLVGGNSYADATSQYIAAGFELTGPAISQLGLSIEMTDVIGIALDLKRKAESQSTTIQVTNNCNTGDNVVVTNSQNVKIDKKKKKREIKKSTSDQVQPKRKRSAPINNQLVEEHLNGEGHAVDAMKKMFSIGEVTPQSFETHVDDDAQLTEKQLEKKLSKDELVQRALFADRATKRKEDEESANLTGVRPTKFHCTGCTDFSCLWSASFIQLCKMTEAEAFQFLRSHHVMYCSDKCCAGDGEDSSAAVEVQDEEGDAAKPILAYHGDVACLFQGSLPDPFTIHHFFMLTGKVRLEKKKTEWTAPELHEIPDDLPADRLVVTRDQLHHYYKKLENSEYCPCEPDKFKVVKSSLQRLEESSPESHGKAVTYPCSLCKKNFAVTLPFTRKSPRGGNKSVNNRITFLQWVLAAFLIAHQTKLSLILTRPQIQAGHKPKIEVIYLGGVFLRRWHNLDEWLRRKYASFDPQNFPPLFRGEIFGGQYISIDETLFGCAQDFRVQCFRIEKYWVFTVAIYEPVAYQANNLPDFKGCRLVNVFFYIVPNRKEATLMQIIAQHCHGEHITINSDCYAAYNTKRLEQGIMKYAPGVKKVTHIQVNHSISFNNEHGETNNMAESANSLAKRFVKNQMQSNDGMNLYCRLAAAAARLCCRTKEKFLAYILSSVQYLRKYNIEYADDMKAKLLDVASKRFTHINVRCCKVDPSFVPPPHFVLAFYRPVKPVTVACTEEFDEGLAETLPEVRDLCCAGDTAASLEDIEDRPLDYVPWESTDRDMTPSIRSPCGVIHNRWRKLRNEPEEKWADEKFTIPDHMPLTRFGRLQAVAMRAFFSSPTFPGHKVWLEETPQGEHRVTVKFCFLSQEKSKQLARRLGEVYREQSQERYQERKAMHLEKNASKKKKKKKREKHGDTLTKANLLKMEVKQVLEETNTNMIPAPDDVASCVPSTVANVPQTEAGLVEFEDLLADLNLFEAEDDFIPNESGRSQAFKMISKLASNVGQITLGSYCALHDSFTPMTLNTYINCPGLVGPKEIDVLAEKGSEVGSTLFDVLLADVVMCATHHTVGVLRVTDLINFKTESQKMIRDIIGRASGDGEMQRKFAKAELYLSSGTWFTQPFWWWKEYFRKTVVVPLLFRSHYSALMWVPDRVHGGVVKWFNSLHNREQTSIDVADQKAADDAEEFTKRSAQAFLSFMRYVHKLHGHVAPRESMTIKRVKCPRQSNNACAHRVIDFVAQELSSQAVLPRNRWSLVERLLTKCKGLFGDVEPVDGYESFAELGKGASDYSRYTRFIGTQFVGQLKRRGRSADIPALSIYNLLRNFNASSSSEYVAQRTAYVDSFLSAPPDSWPFRPIKLEEPSLSNLAQFMFPDDEWPRFCRARENAKRFFNALETPEEEEEDPDSTVDGMSHFFNQRTFFTELHGWEIPEEPKQTDVFTREDLCTRLAQLFRYVAAAPTDEEVAEGEQLLVVTGDAVQDENGEAATDEDGDDEEQQMDTDEEAD